MLAKNYTCSLRGIDAVVEVVEVDLFPGFPWFAVAARYYRQGEQWLLGIRVPDSLPGRQ